MKPLDVSGTSMWPLLKSGDLVFTDTQAPRQGDLIAIQIEQVIVVHRLLNANTTKGDRFRVQDQPADSAQPTLRVAAVVLRRRKQKSGRLVLSRLDTAPLRALSCLQAELSWLQMKLPWSGLQLCLHPFLITNGFLMRSLLYAQWSKKKLGDVDVVQN